jgi:hypothetical protein
MAFAHGIDTVGQILVDAADSEATVAIPLLCAIEAYSLLHRGEHELVRLLRRNPTVRTVSPGAGLDTGDDCPTIGAMARRAGRLGAGHATYVALVCAASVVTSRPDQIRSGLGDEWPIVEAWAVT